MQRRSLRKYSGRSCRCFDYKRAHTNVGKRIYLSFIAFFLVMHSDGRYISRAFQRQLTATRGDSVKNFNPMRRQLNVRVEEFQGEVLVYDLERHTAHCLNGIAVNVWKYADGTLSIAEIADRITAEQGTEVDEALVWRALEEIDRASLLDTPLTAAPEDLTRRFMFAKLGWAAAVPLVLSIAVPTPAFAQSAVPTAT